MKRKTRVLIFSLFLMAFSISTFLSIPGVIPLISEYFDVPYGFASLFVSLFTFILAVTGLVFPSYLSRFERRKFLIFSLIVFIISAVAQIFVTNFWLALAIRLIPAFLYSSAISISLTIVSEISPKNTNRVILGVSAGTIFGLSITTYVGMTYGYPIINLWMAAINLLALVFIVAFFPEMEGKEETLDLPFSDSFTVKFAVTTMFMMLIGISTSILYNYFTLILMTMTHINDQSLLSIYLLSNGFAAIFGTVFYGYMLQKNSKLAIFSYPIAFAVVIALFGLLIRIPLAIALLITAFGVLDGSMHTISQYWITSADREHPEFANGYYIFINNINRTIGIFIGAVIIDHLSLYDLFILPIILLLCSIPFFLYRIRRFPDSCENVS